MRKTSIALLALVATASLAQSPPSSPSAYGAPIGLKDAQALVELGVELSKARGFKMAIAVVEPSGELVAFARMDDAPYGAIELAQHKARTAARFRLPTVTAEERVQAGRVGLVTAEGFTAIGGGVPIVANDRVVGALGVSGATAAEDAALAAKIVASR